MTRNLSDILNDNAPPRVTSQTPLICFPITARDSSNHKEIREKTLIMVDSGVVLFCFSGEVKITLDNEPVTIPASSLCSFTTHNTLRYVSVSDDFEGFLLIVNPSMVGNIDTHISITFFLYNRDNPVVKIPERELGSIREGMYMLKKRSERCGHPYNNEIIKHILMISLYELCALYEKQARRAPATNKKNLREQELLKEFLGLVEQECHKERSLAHYAERLCLTPKYLSSSIKRLSGQSGAEWIDKIVVQRIKSELMTPNLTIQQVSDRLNFPNASFFGKYFKKHTGLTPREYKTARAGS